MVEFERLVSVFAFFLWYFFFFFLLFELFGFVVCAGVVSLRREGGLGAGMGESLSHSDRFSILLLFGVPCGHVSVSFSVSVSVSFRFRFVSFFFLFFSSKSLSGPRRSRFWPIAATLCADTCAVETALVLLKLSEPPM